MKKKRKKKEKGIYYADVNEITFYKCNSLFCMKTADEDRKRHRDAEKKTVTIW